jgi:hypothetical protein
MQTGRRWPFKPVLELQRLNVRSLPTLRPLHNVELNGLTLLEALEAAGINRRIVNEYIFTVLAANESKPLRVIEPLYCSLFHVVSFLLLLLIELP